ncbi:MAG: class I SAM-dependent methyltransferase [Methanomassiliicoccales archaeon]|nr:class I SAM-dependent methyltransferase [Methanomassiliicoccales archaeon]NYT16239.1 class I SAM-dependent methyltransferase [Methanomassiliicoccales archaeon]
MSEKKQPLVENQSIDSGRIWFEHLESLIEPPHPFSAGAPFWDDPYISKNLLNSFIDAEKGVASRPPEVILSSVEWMISRCGLDRGSCILDLGCGPGPYCQHFAEMGMKVTGVDLSITSLRYASVVAQSSGLEIEYLEGDYLQMQIDEKFDLIIMAYGDLCTLGPDDRDLLLRKVHSWLKPDGYFVFDVVTYSRLQHLDQVNRWYTSHDSFWRSGPYLLLEHSFDYLKEGVRLEQYIVIEDNGKIAAYRFWYKHYSEMELEKVLRKADLEIENIYGDLIGSSYSEECDWMGVVTRPL